MKISNRIAYIVVLMTFLLLLAALLAKRALASPQEIYAGLNCQDGVFVLQYPGLADGSGEVVIVSAERYILLQLEFIRNTDGIAYWHSTNWSRPPFRGTHVYTIDLIVLRDINSTTYYHPQGISSVCTYEQIYLPAVYP